MTDTPYSDELDEILTFAINRGVNESFVLDDEQCTQLYKKDCERIAFDAKQAISDLITKARINELNGISQIELEDIGDYVPNRISELQQSLTNKEYK